MGVHDAVLGATERSHGTGHTVQVPNRPTGVVVVLVAVQLGHQRVRVAEPGGKVSDAQVLGCVEVYEVEHVIGECRGEETVLVVGEIIERVELNLYI